MNKRVLRRAACAAVAVVLSAGLPAYGQDPSESAVPSSSEAPSAPAEAPEAPAKEPAREPAKEPEKPAAEPARPDLKITTSFEDREYLMSEEIPITVTITNNGDAEAKAVKGGAYSVSGPSFFLPADDDWKEFKQSGPGGTIAAHASVTLEVRGRVDRSGNGNALARFYVETTDEANIVDNAQDITVRVVPPSKKSTVGGFVYGDKNDNGEFDAGEGLAGVEMRLWANGEPAPDLSAKSAADGRFDIRDVPARLYYLSYPSELPGDWVATGQLIVRADGSDASTDLRVRAVRPLREALKVTAKFNEGPYKPGDKATLTITLNNTGAKTLKRIVAGCDRGGFPSRHLAGWDDPAQWGDLAMDRGKGKGVTLKPGETKSLQVSGTVPDGSIEEGVVYIGCDFGPIDQQYLTGFPSVFVLAKVPGKSGTSAGTFFHDRNDNWTVDEGEAIGDLEVVLADPLDGSEVAKAKTQADGSIKFGTLPAGWYVPVFHGPWKLRDPGFIVVSTNPLWSEGWVIRLVPGQANQPPDTQPNAPIPSKKVENKALAKTGADVTGLAIGGFAVLIVGIGAVLFTRKRRRKA